MQQLVRTQSPLDWSRRRPFHCETIPLVTSSPRCCLLDRLIFRAIENSSMVEITTQCTLMRDEYQVPRPP